MTATIIPTPTRINNQVQGQFYPLQREELIALRKNRLINNVAFVHLALRYENPYCDRPIEIIPKEFAERWSLPESSIYEALGKLKRLGVLALKTGRVLLQWLSPDATKEEIQNIEDNLESQINEVAEPEPFPAHLSDRSEIPELILESQNQFQKPRINSESPEKQEPESLLGKASKPSKTIKTTQTTQTHQTQQTRTKNGKRDEVIDKPRPLPSSNDGRVSASLEEAGIPYDDDVEQALKTYHVSQVMKAIAIVASKENISYPKSYFLKIVGQQPKEDLGTRGEVFHASKAGWTLEEIKHLHGNNWKKAAIHHGIPIDEE